MPIELHGLQALRMDLPSPTHLKLNPGPQQLLLLRGLHSDGLSFFLRLHWVWPSLLCPPAGHWPRCHRSDSVDSRRTVVPTCYSVRVSSGCHNNIPQIEGLEQQTLTVSKFWKLEIQDQDAIWCGSWWGLSSWLADGHLLAVCLCAIGSELYRSHWILGKELMASI